MILAKTDYVDVVDIYYGATGRWATATLSLARTQFDATSLPQQSLALFAGGMTSISDTTDGGRTFAHTYTIMFACAVNFLWRAQHLSIESIFLTEFPALGRQPPLAYLE